MPSIGTLCWIIKDNKVLLKLANRGVSKDKWNAPGGKAEKNETPLNCVFREVLEETGLKIVKPQYHGKLTFFFGRTKDPDWIVHIFSTRDFLGNLKESEEGKLEWFDLGKIPFKRMWADDQYWVPLLLQGKKFDGVFYFDKKGEKIFNFDIWVR